MSAKKTCPPPQIFLIILLQNKTSFLYFTWRGRLPCTTRWKEMLFLDDSDRWKDPLLKWHKPNHTQDSVLTWCHLFSTTDFFAPSLWWWKLNLKHQPVPFFQSVEWTEVIGRCTDNYHKHRKIQEFFIISHENFKDQQIWGRSWPTSGGGVAGGSSGNVHAQVL